MTRLAELGSRLVVAHRGASREAPENTLAAFDRALALGADALELDVRLARDGAAVVIHDATLDRTTTTGGRVDARSSAELGRLGVPLLRDVLAAFPTAQLLVEIKEGRAQSAVSAAIRASRAEHRCAVAAADRSALAEFRGGPIAVCGSRPEIASLRWRSLLGLRAGRVDYRLLSVPPRYRGLPLATPGFFAAAGRAGVPVHVWTIDDPAAAVALWRAGATGIVTNDPGAVLAVRG